VTVQSYFDDCEPFVDSCDVTVVVLLIGASAPDRVTVELSVLSEVESESDDVDPLLVDFTRRTLPADLRSVVSVESNVFVPLEVCACTERVSTEAPPPVVPPPFMSAPAPPDQVVVPDWLLDIEASEWLPPSASVQSCCEKLLLLRASIVSLWLPPRDSPDWVTPGVSVGWPFSLWVWLESE
jgi:hypothetical protein